MIKDAILVVVCTIVLLGLFGKMEERDRETEAAHAQEIKVLAKADARRLARELRAKGYFGQEHMVHPIGKD